MIRRTAWEKDKDVQRLQRIADTSKDPRKVAAAEAALDAKAEQWAEERAWR